MGITWKLQTRIKLNFISPILLEYSNLSHINQLESFHTESLSYTDTITLSITNNNWIWNDDSLDGATAWKALGTRVLLLQAISALRNKSKTTYPFGGCHDDFCGREKKKPHWWMGIGAHDNFYDLFVIFLFSCSSSMLHLPLMLAIFTSSVFLIRSCFPLEYKWKNSPSIIPSIFAIRSI